MKVSVIIPYMEINAEKPAVLKRLVDSLEGYDELLVMGNWREGYAKPINRGLNLATGDFLIVMNDDLVMDKGGSLRDICKPGVVTSPTVDGHEQPFWGCVFCIPREVYEKVGGLDERYRISYFDDDDYINTLRKHRIEMESVPLVNFWNPSGGGTTLHEFPDHNEFFAENKQKFIEKWGYEPSYMTEYFNQYGKLPPYQEL